MSRRPSDPSQIENPRSQIPSFLGWLGRQVGHVAKAVRADPDAAGRGGGRTLYRRTRVEQSPLPGTPGVVLRRTTTDEAIEGPGLPPPANRPDSS